MIPVLIADAVALTVAWVLPGSMPIPGFGATKRARVDATAVQECTC